MWEERESYSIIELINGVETFSKASQPYLCTERCFPLFFLHMSHLIYL